MAIWILTWKEAFWPYWQLRDLVEKFQRDGPVEHSWRVSAHRAARAGDQVLLLKQGDNPRGVIGFGELLGAASLQEESGKQRWHALVRFDRLTDPKESFLISMEELKDAVPDWPSMIRGSGQLHLNSQAEAWLTGRLQIPRPSGS